MNLLNFIFRLPPVGKVAVLIFFALVFVSGLIWLLSQVMPSRNWSELKLRVLSWWIMVGVFFPVVSFSQTLTIIFFACLSFWALKEYVTILDTRRADHRALFWAFLSIPIQYYWVGTQWYGMFIIFIPVYMFLYLPLRLVLTEETSGFLSSAAKIQWGLMAFVFGLSHLAYLSIMPQTGASANGQSLLLFLVIITESNDIFQYAWGRLFGKRRILPAVSPKKTAEGFWGGVTTTTLFSLTIRFLTPFGIVETLFIAFCISVAGFFGDVVMSAVKRDAGIKDFGDLIPGHGGMLDRVDSLCYTAPLFFHIVRYFYY